MKKFYLLLLIVFIILSFTGCSKDVGDTSSSSFKISFPTDETVNGFRSEVNSSKENKTEEIKEAPSNPAYYCGNLKTHKIHLPDCRYVKSTNKDNIFINENKAFFEDMGYTDCGHCKP